MDIPTIKAWPREQRRSRACRRLRKRGLIPAVLYGRGEPNVLLSVQRRELTGLLEEHSSVLQVDLDGHRTPAQLKEVQYAPVGSEVIHADFGRISLTETVRVAVPIEMHGEAAGVKEGGVLELLLHEIEVECFPTAIPENIRVDVSGLNIGDDLRVLDLPLPQEVQSVHESNAVVLLVARPSEVAEEEETEEQALAEPEVIGKPSEGEEAPEGKSGREQ